MKYHTIGGVGVMIGPDLNGGKGGGVTGLFRNSGE